MPAKRLQNLLNPNESGGLSDIVRRARDMGDLLQILQKALPPDQAGAIAAANFREGGELVILASSPAWAARLRFETEPLIDAARAHGNDVTSCTVRVLRD